MEFAQRSGDPSMNLWGRKWSPRPIPLPSYLLLRTCLEMVDVEELEAWKSTSADSRESCQPHPLYVQCECSLYEAFHVSD